MTIEAFIKKHPSKYVSLLEATTCDQARLVFAALLADKRFYQLNLDNSSRCIIAAQYYIEMLNETQVQKALTTPAKPTESKKVESKAVEAHVSASTAEKQFEPADSEQLRMEDLGEPDDPLIAQLEKMHIPYVDKRSANGCLWIIGDSTLSLAVEELKAKGYTFLYAAGGGKSTNYKPAWYMNSKPTVVLADDLLKIVSDDDMAPLRQKLIEGNILTLKEFQRINPWIFMNRHMLYNIGQRQDILTASSMMRICAGTSPFINHTNLQIPCHPMKNCIFPESVLMPMSIDILCSAMT